MSICIIDKITKDYGGNVIFSDVSFEINEGERIGIVGNNGSGKTTLFKLLAGKEQPNNGSIYVKKNTKVGYLEQLPIVSNNTAVYEVLKGAFKELILLEQRLKELETTMSMTKEDKRLQELLKEYGEAQEQFTIAGGYEMEAEINKVVNGLHLDELIDNEFASLSGGEKTKVGLGIILLKKPDLLLLDEPTNHLDITSVEWLEEYLLHYAGTVIIISHDRYFLDQVVTKIIDLDNGEVSIYHTNYSMYVKEKEERLLAAFSAYQDQQKKIKKMKEAIKRLREWANRANPPNEGMHRRASSMEKALERIEKIDKPNINPQKISLKFDMNERSGKDVITIKELSKSFGDVSLLKNVGLNIKYSEKCALLGSNGSGKTTLIKMILGELEPDSGAIQIGSNLNIGYLSQHVMNNYDDYSVIDAFRDKVIVTEERARNILAKFLFYGNAVFRKVKDLSGGEKTRLKLAQLMHQELNLLILDEPTNHLDIASREELEEALEAYNGTIFCISHDRYFINKLFNQVYWLENGRLEEFKGSYDYARKKREDRVIDTSNNTTSQNYIKTIKNRVNDVLKMKQRTSQDIEGEIDKIEQELMLIEDKMFEEKELDNLQKLQRKHDTMEMTRNELYQELENILAMR